MFTNNELMQFANVCTSIGNDVANATGFVKIQDLLKTFDAKLFVRPLLVEGMLVSLHDADVDNTTSRTHWAVLLDSETYPITTKDVEKENQNNPLPSRLRNTVAHELVHSLAFRPTEFGIQLLKTGNAKKSNAESVEEIEQQTEQFSPLLLWPENSLKIFLDNLKQPVNAGDLKYLLQNMAISRYVLINRLRLLPLDNKIRNKKGLENIGIGIGEWRENGKAVLRSWPLFFNFERNVVPRFLLTLRRQDRLPLESIIPDYESMTSNVNYKTTSLEVKASASGVANSLSMKVNYSLEHTNKKVGSTFLFVVQKISENK